MKDEKIDYSGKNLQIVSWEGEPGKRYEKAVRAPGVRVLAEYFAEDGAKKVYLTKENRRESEGVDYRLPGGKVFDSLKEFTDFKGDKEELISLARTKAKQEAKEEAGIISNNFELIGISKAGASVDWDLYYFLATNVSLGENELKENEIHDMQGLASVNPWELFTLLSEGRVQEGRSAAYLWDWLVKNNYINITNSLK